MSNERAHAQSGGPQAELTARAILTGMVLGALLAPCNVYSGLKIGWSFNMSIISALLSVAFWGTFHRLLPIRRWGLLECNINQTTASSAASIISSGLAAPIPALALITGTTLPLPTLVFWVFAVSLLGIVVAMSVRPAMLFRQQLPFPAGIATAETVRDIFARGREAAVRIAILLTSLTGAAGFKIAADIAKLPYTIPLGGGWAGTGAFAGRSLRLSGLTFGFDVSLLMLGFGAIIGLRTGISLLLGAILAWGFLAPLALDRGWVASGSVPTEGSWFGPLVEVLLWPGVALMVTASLVSFAAAFVKRRPPPASTNAEAKSESPSALAALPSPDAPAQRIPRRWLWIGLGIASTLAVAAQILVFDIDWHAALLAVPVSFVLGIVASRVVGETGIAPIGAIGKISQLAFAAIAPGSVTANLMTANVAGGTAGQAGDLLNDLKTGWLVGATARRQIIAQVFGVLTGSFAGCAAYLVLIPNPREMLLTPEWPAPAVAVWKTVAETLQSGLGAIPNHSLVAMAIGIAAGLVLSLTPALRPETRKFLPSASALGLAFVLPASLSVTLFLGAAAGFGFRKIAPSRAQRFLIVIAAGLIAGESLGGTVTAVLTFLSDAP